MRFASTQPTIFLPDAGICAIAAILAFLGKLKRRIEKLHKCSTHLS
ncbi:MAG: hypothetical protein V7L05_02200 [Nostoc sp.]